MLKTIFPWTELALEGAEALAALPLAASCPVYSTFVENPLGEGGELRSPISHPPALLQLRNAHLLLFDPLAQQVLAACPCSPSLSLALRQPRPYPQQAAEGDPKEQTFSVVQLAHSAQPHHRLAFLVRPEDRKALEYFGIALEKSAIILKDFHQKFKPLRKLGKGATAAVYSAVRHRDSSVVAVKAFNKSSHFAVGGGKGKRAFEQELRVLCECAHENLCSFEGVFETENTLYLVMPAYERTLTSLLHASAPLPRDLVALLVRQLLQGLAHLHAQGLMHRDLKLENIMLHKSPAGTRAVIIDMGMAERVAADAYLFEQCGTPGYAAPEIFGPRPPHPEKCDVFSLGVIFHILLFKKPVFPGSSSAEVCHNNRAAKLVLDAQLAQEDEPVRDLLLRMLELDNAARISASEALEHELFTGSVKTPVLSSVETDLETQGVPPLAEI